MYVMNVCACFEEQEAHPHHKSRWSYCMLNNWDHPNTLVFMFVWIYFHCSQLKKKKKKRFLAKHRLTNDTDYLILALLWPLLSIIVSDNCSCLISTKVLCVWIVLIKQQATQCFVILLYVRDGLEVECLKAPSLWLIQSEILLFCTFWHY